ncbi:MAG: hypothetical protein AB8B96_10370 [Lysobacterales bacterium]
MPVYKFQPQLTPKTKLGGILTAIAGLGLGALMLFLGVFVGLALLAVGTVFVVGLKLRMWWLARRGDGVGPTAEPTHTPGARPSAGPGKVLEGEYEVVKKPPDQP